MTGPRGEGRGGAAAEEEPPVEILDTPEAGRAVIRGGIWRSTAWIAGLLVSTASAPLLARHLGITDYGRYLTIITLGATIALVADNALSNIALREYTSRPRGERKPLLRNLLGLRLCLTVIGLGLAFAFAVAAGYGSEQLSGLALIGVSLLLIDYAGAAQVPLGVALRVGWLSLIDLARNLVTAAGIVLLVLGDAGIVAFYVVPVIAAAVGLVLAFAVARGEAARLPRAQWPVWAPILRDVLPVAAATTFASLYFRVVLLVASVAGTARVVGDFGVAFRIMEIAIALPMLAVATAFPVIVRAAQRDPRRLRYILGRIVEAGAVLGTGLAVAIVTLAPLGVLFITGERIDAAIDALRIQGLAMPATFLVTSWGYALLSLREHRKLLVANATALVSAVALTFALTPPLGVIGPAIAILATELLLAAIYAVQLRRAQIRLDVSRRAPVVALLAGVAACALGLTLPLPAPLDAAVALGFYGAVVLAAAASPPELLEALGRRPS